MNFLWVGIGGSFGAVARHLLGRAITHRVGGRIPWGTLVINVSGAFLLGIFTRALQSGAVPGRDIMLLLLGTGFCGAYTTFSTFSYEAWMLVRDGQALLSLAYMALTLCLGLAAAGLGLYGGP